MKFILSFVNLIKGIWGWLDGKKTTIGVIIHFIAFGLKGINFIDDTTFNNLQRVAEYVMVFGIAFKGVKLMQ